MYLPGRKIVLLWGCLLFTFVLISFVGAGGAYAADRYWVGSSDGANTNDTANWSATSNSCGVGGGASIPGSGDVARFTSSCTNGATINASMNVLGIDIAAGYTGTVTQSSGNSITMGSSGFSQASGTFLGGDSNIDINGGSFSESGGNFTSTSATLSIEQDFTITDGTFSHNSGIVDFDGSSSSVLSCNSVSFNTVSFSKTSATANATVGSNCTLPFGDNATTTAGTLTNNGTITVGSGIWTINATLSQSSGGASITFSGTTIDMNSKGNAGLNPGDWNVTGGTFSAGLLTNLSLQGSLDNSGNYLPAGVTFTLDGSTSLDDSNITCSGSEAFTSITINKTHSSAETKFLTDCTTSELRRTDGIVLNSDTSKILSVSGNIIINSTDAFGGGNLTITLTGNAIQSITNSDSATFSSPLIVNKSGNEADLSSDFTVTGQSCTIQGGTLDVSGYTLVCGGSGLTVQSGGNFQLQGTETLPTIVLQSGSTVTYDGALGPYNISNLDYHHLTINGMGAEFDLVAGESIAGDLTISAGIFDLNGQSLSVSGTFSNDGTIKLQGGETVSLTMDYDSGTAIYNGTSSYTGLKLGNNYNNLEFNGSGGQWTLNAGLNVDGNLTLASGTLVSSTNTINLQGSWINTGGTFTGTNGTVIFDGTTQEIQGTTTFNNFTKQVSSTDTLTFPATLTQTITGTLTLKGQSGSVLSLRSSTGGTQWKFDPQGTRDIEYLDVKDSNNVNSTMIDVSGLNITDSGNNTGWAFDLTPPSISLTAYTPDPTSDTTPSITGTAVDAISTVSSVEYQMDGTSGSWTSCVADDGTFDESSEAFTCTVAELSAGTHTIYVRATDSLSNTIQSGNYSSDEFTVDLTPPSISLTAYTPDPTSDTTPSITGTATDAVSTVASVEYQMDGTSGSWTSCVADDGTFDESSEAFTCTVAELSAGTHTIYVRATDSLSNAIQSGNYSSDEFTVDATAPTNGSITITGTKRDGTSSSTYTGGRSVTLALSAVGASQMIISENSNFSGASWITYATSYAFSLSASDGTKTVYVKYRDDALNESSTYSDSIILDVTSPESFKLSDPHADVTFTPQEIKFKWESAKDTTSGINEYRLYVDGEPIRSNKNNDQDHTEGDETILKEGKHTWYVRAFDEVGNSRNTEKRTFYVDKSGPYFQEVYVNWTKVSEEKTYAIDNSYVEMIVKADDPLEGINGGVQSGVGEIKIEIYSIGVLGDSLYLTINVDAEEGRIFHKLDLKSGKKYKVVLSAIDNLGNTGEKFSFTLDSKSSADYDKLYQEKKEDKPSVPIESGGISPDFEKKKNESQKPIEKKKKAIEMTYDTDNADGSSKEKIPEKAGKKYWSFIDKIKNFFKKEGSKENVSEEKDYYAYEEGSGFFHEIKASISNLFAFVFDKNPTQIYDVKVEEVGRDYAVVSWKTNHYTYNNKVNYGESTSYGEWVESKPKAKFHRIKLKGLEPDKEYYFEVMSQGKNYAYDAYRTFKTTK